MHMAHSFPRIIQGGMGIGASGYRLAKAVSCHGGLGVVSGSAIDTVFVRRLQDGDLSGHLRRALAAFPFLEIAKEVLDAYFIPGGRAPSLPYRCLTLPSDQMSQKRLDIMIVASFAEVFLAKEGHDGPIGMNLLTKIQLPTLPTLFGAMLAGVDVVLMGAGIPTAIPGILEKLARWEVAELKLVVEDNPTNKNFSMIFDPMAHLHGRSTNREPLGKALKRPAFFAIISSHILAKTLHKKATGKVDGFVVESHVAAGHNAPPRRVARSSASDGSAAESVWGAVDEPDLEVIRGIGLPFWLAGCQSKEGALQQARALGAHGIQVGTPFAFCEESDFDAAIKESAISQVLKGRLRVVTDFEASPTSYPFKLALDQDRPEELIALRARERVCDLGYLRQAYVDENGSLGYRCSGEPQATFAKKGGDLSLSRNKMCLCNGLLATIGQAQHKGPRMELPILTAGEGLDDIRRFIPPHAASYRAEHVLAGLRNND